MIHRLEPDGQRSAAVAWTWRYESAGGEPIERLDGSDFPTQSDAESWLGETWQDLLADGVARVVLLDGEREEYAMPLSPAQ